MLEKIKELLKEKGILNKLTGDKIADVVILTQELLMDADFCELVTNIGLTEVVNYITANSKEKSIETGVKVLIEKYESESVQVEEIKEIESNESDEPKFKIGDNVRVISLNDGYGVIENIKDGTAYIKFNDFFTNTWYSLNELKLINEEIEDDWDVILLEDDYDIPKGAKGKDLQPGNDIPYIAWDKPYNKTYEYNYHQNVFAVPRCKLKKIK